MKIDPIALLEEADRGAANAYCPYSKFQVGAALLTKSGDVFRGCNVENVSFGLTNCAERTAVHTAIAMGHKEFVAIAIVQGAGQPGADQPCWPCGACRQVLAEFNPDMDVIFREGDGHRITKLRELLPHSFDVHRLQAT